MVLAYCVVVSLHLLKLTACRQASVSKTCEQESGVSGMRGRIVTKRRRKEGEWQQRERERERERKTDVSGRRQRETLGLDASDFPPSRVSLLRARRIRLISVSAQVALVSRRAPPGSGLYTPIMKPDSRRTIPCGVPRKMES